jgi:hypothetical protein
MNEYRQKVASYALKSVGHCVPNLILPYDLCHRYMDGGLDLSISVSDKFCRMLYEKLASISPLGLQDSKILEILEGKELNGLNAMTMSSVAIFTDLNASIWNGLKLITASFFEQVAIIYPVISFLLLLCYIVIYFRRRRQYLVTLNSHCCLANWIGSPNVIPNSDEKVPLIIELEGN